jgi:hypothetical protein
MHACRLCVSQLARLKCPSIIQGERHKCVHEKHLCLARKHVLESKTQMTKVVTNHTHDLEVRVCTLTSSSCAKISSPSDMDRSFSPPGSNNLLVDRVLWRLVMGRIGSLVSGGCCVSRDLTHVYIKVPTRIVNTDAAR